MINGIVSTSQNNACTLLLWSLDRLLAGNSDTQEPVPPLDSFTEADWTEFSQLVLNEGVAGALTKSLDYQPETFPAELADAFLIYLENQKAGNERRTEAFLEVLRELHSAGVRTIPFKGPVLAEKTLGDIGARGFWDFDFLFPKAQIPGLETVLRRLGFRNAPPESPRQQAAFWAYSGQDVFIRENDSLALEPHWAFCPSTLAVDLNYEEIWQRSRVQEWRGVQVNLLSDEDWFIMLAIHGGKEAWSRLKYIFDLASFMQQHQNLDWDYIRNVAQSKGLGRLFNLAVTMVNETFTSCRDLGSPLRTEDSVVNRLVQRIQSSEGSITSGIYDLNSYYVMIRERRSDKFKYLSRTLLTPREKHFEALKIPDSLFFLYVPFKVILDGLLLPLWARWKSLTGAKKEQPSA